MSTSMMALGKRRAVLAHCFAFLIALTAIPALASASPGKLDPSFGKNGKVIGRTAPLVDMAKLRNGDTVVASKSALYAYLPNGKPDRRFGAKGVVTPFASVEGQITIAGVAVDRRGRIFLAGNGAPKAGESGGRVAIERYLPNGKADLSFGSDGVAITDFGLPQPARPAGIPDSAQISLPVEVNASGIAIDSGQRIVVTGTRAATYSGTKLGTFVPVPEAFAARLTANGSLDGSFNGNGSSQLPGLASISAPALDRRDRVDFMASRTPSPDKPEGPLSSVVGRLRANGTADPSFGNGGWRSLDDRFDSESRLAVTLDRNGRLLVFAGANVERLKADGSVDRSFGRKGVVEIKRQGAEVKLGGVAAGAEKILVVGTLLSQPKRPSESTHRLLLARLNDDGSLDRTFGETGMATTAFGRKSAPEGSAVLLDGGRALAGGTATYGPRRPSHFVLARYLLD